jgi:glyoxylase-like metal-dependent hydrolase (beta-lactamase superfamily II)
MEASAVLNGLQSRNFRLNAVFVTHAHHDHIRALDGIVRATGARVYARQGSQFTNIETFQWGARFELNALKLETRRTTGHATDGTTYVIEGLEKPVAIVGDALFAGSMGGGIVSYKEALETTRASIFSLSEGTILCPGHGPVTTVGLEKRHNPFFAQ